MPARDYYLKYKTLETLCQREQRPTHAHRCAGLACGARSAPGGVGGGCARPAGECAAVCGAPAGRVPVAGLASGRFHHRRTPHLCVLGLGARHGGIVKLSGVRCVTVFACFTYLLTAPWPARQYRSLETPGFPPPEFRCLTYFDHPDYVAVRK
jgi:hypothetical protein